MSPPLSDADRIDADAAFVPVHIAVLTVSDTRTKDDDVSGDTLVKRIEEAGHILCARTILPDDEMRIRAQLKTWIADPRCDVVISTGGTGLTGRGRLQVELLARRLAAEEPCDVLYTTPRRRTQESAAVA